ncbi:hypothetical protein [Aphanothece sacrum]|uniref:ThiS family protein n=1 Tax=Aphanothece sacrum FPU1 TaxID=1920663 RepID=A0A401IKQ0_APHSA|nr:hypothetical protein [Aphanothece sacrum]GBF81821.1 thiS family protein [Aphanothece sacrum FPU1]GBF84353.1 thiS family protein [Aphanothece sacrum FPU3]
MATITLVENADHKATEIHLMTAQPMNVNLTGLAGGAIQFTCTNPLATIQGARTVDITYDASVPQQHQTIQVSSVIA